MFAVVIGTGPVAAFAGELAMASTQRAPRKAEHLVRILLVLINYFPLMALA